VTTHAGAGEGVAYAVGLGEVARRLGGGAAGEERVDNTKRITSPGTPWSSRSRTVKKLPSDFDIFCPRPVSIRCAARCGRRSCRGGRSALGDLVLVVRELQVDAAAVDVEGLAQDARRHMAEHSMCQPGRPRPQGLSQPGSSGRRLPQHEVHRVALVGRDLDAGAGDHVVERAAATARRTRRSCRPRTGRGPRPRRRGPGRSASRSSRPSAG
jgi:hypothetical protein